MTAQLETLLCLYQYDPLDRVVGCTPLNHDNVQRFYQKNRLATEIQGQVQFSVFEHEAQLLAQRRFEAGSVDCALLATDLQRSVLHSITVGQHQKAVYSPYGHRSPEDGLISLLGFSGERRDPVTGHYLLGNGYRAFNPVLGRFNSPDSLSPFGKGGVNGYAYCGGDPVNRVDPTGHSFLSAFLGKYLQRAVDTFTPNVLNRSARNSPAKAIAAGSTVQSPISGASSNVSTLEALDLASPSGLMAKSGQGTRDIGKLGLLFDAKEQAATQFKTTERDLISLERLFHKESMDFSELPASPAFKAHSEARTQLSHAASELQRGIDIHFLKYPSQRKNAVANANWALRRTSIR
jgi:RHS repeat-associated protein